MIIMSCHPLFFFFKIFLKVFAFSSLVVLAFGPPFPGFLLLVFRMVEPSDVPLLCSLIYSIWGSPFNVNSRMNPTLEAFISGKVPHIPNIHTHPPDYYWPIDQTGLRPCHKFDGQVKLILLTSLGRVRG